MSDDFPFVSESAPRCKDARHPRWDARESLQRASWVRPRGRPYQLLAVVRAGQRAILNSLLFQIGIADRIGDAELPRHGIERLLKLGGNEQQVATLETCRRWLKNFIIPISSSIEVTRVVSG